VWASRSAQEARKRGDPIASALEDRAERARLLRDKIRSQQSETQTQLLGVKPEVQKSKTALIFS
jgi:hypothetical protein